MLKPGKCLKGSNTFYVFVRYDGDTEKYEAFLETADTVVTRVEVYVAEEKASGKSGMLFWGLPESPGEQNRLAQEWQHWRPSGAGRP